MKECRDWNFDKENDVFCLPNDHDPNMAPGYFPNYISAHFDLSKVYAIDDFEESIYVDVKISLDWYD